MKTGQPRIGADALAKTMGPHHFFGVGSTGRPHMQFNEMTDGCVRQKVAGA
jgi:hypothetical protein